MTNHRKLATSLEFAALPEKDSLLVISKGKSEFESHLR
jgi:hypothetical protein